MAHRTLNPVTAFWGDGRERGQQTKPRAHDKYAESQVAWVEQFPDEPYPNYYGAAYDAYYRLTQAGWRWSSRHGWRRTTSAALLDLTVKEECDA